MHCFNVMGTIKNLSCVRLTCNISPFRIEQAERNARSSSFCKIPRIPERKVLLSILNSNKKFRMRHSFIRLCWKFCNAKNLAIHVFVDVFKNMHMAENILHKFAIFWYFLSLVINK